MKHPKLKIGPAKTSVFAKAAKEIAINLGIAAVLMYTLDYVMSITKERLILTNQIGPIDNNQYFYNNLSTFTPGFWYFIIIMTGIIASIAIVTIVVRTTILKTIQKDSKSSPEKEQRILFGYPICFIKLITICISFATVITIAVSTNHDQAKEIVADKLVNYAQSQNLSLTEDQALKIITSNDYVVYNKDGKTYSIGLNEVSLHTYELVNKEGAWSKKPTSFRPI